MELKYNAYASNKLNRYWHPQPAGNSNQQIQYIALEQAEFFHDEPTEILEAAINFYLWFESTHAMVVTPQTLEYVKEIAYGFYTQTTPDFQLAELAEEADELEVW